MNKGPLFVRGMIEVDMNTATMWFRRSFWAGAVGAIFLLGATTVSGCKQGEGDRCELTSDCADGLECCVGANTRYQNTCRKKCNPCGDGVLDPGEVCDDGNNVSGDGCKGDCSSDETCGNGIVDSHLDPPEECDPGSDETAHVDCTDLGFLAGTADCRADCTLDLSGCEEGCGNGVKDAEDECDGNDLGNATCESLGFSSGTLGCTDLCTLDRQGCQGGCGNGILEAGEQCDGSVDVTCEDLGYKAGDLACSDDCHYDTSGCQGLAATQVVLDATANQVTVTGDLSGGAALFTPSCRQETWPELVYAVSVPRSGWYLAATVPSTDASACDDPVLVALTDPTTMDQGACDDNDGPGRMAALALWIDATVPAYVALAGAAGLVDFMVRPFPVPSGNCTAAEELPGPGLYAVMISADDDSNRLSGSCVGDQSPEAVFSYRMQSGGQLRVQVESIGDVPFGAYLRGSCVDENSELACGSDSYQSVELVGSGLSAGDRVFVVVESNSEDARTALTLWVTEE